MKKIFSFLMLALLVPFAGIRANASGETVGLRWQGARQADTTVRLSFSVDVPKRALKNGQVMILLPVITDGQHKVSASPVIVYGKGAQVTGQRYEWVSGEKLDTAGAVFAGPGSSVTCHPEVPYQEWMSGSELVVEQVLFGCGSVLKESSDLLSADLLSREEPEQTEEVEAEESQGFVPVSMADTLSLAFPFILPESEFDPDEPIRIYDDERENSMTVYYPLNNMEIISEYMDNEHTLTNLTAAIQMIAESENSRVKYVVVAGFSSPEGSFEVNDRLAWERAISVKEYIMDHTGVPGEKILPYNGSVDWRGLRAYVAASEMPEKEQVLYVLDHTPMQHEQHHNKRVAELRKLNGGETYKYMAGEFFPRLRNGAFIKVYYENGESAEIR